MQIRPSQPGWRRLTSLVLAGIFTMLASGTMLPLTVSSQPGCRCAETGQTSACCCTAKGESTCETSNAKSCCNSSQKGETSLRDNCCDEERQPRMRAMCSCGSSGSAMMLNLDPTILSDRCRPPAGTPGDMLVVTTESFSIWCDTPEIPPPRPW